MIVSLEQSNRLSIYNRGGIGLNVCANGCCAICVTYNPDPEILLKVISACAGQVEKVYVIDNGSTFPIGPFDRFENVESIFLGENRGIAAAINVGIKQARLAVYKYTLLLDQDSILPKDMVRNYLKWIDKLSLLTKQSVAAIGPRYKDPRTGQISFFVRFKWFRNDYLSDPENSPFVPTDFLISSGSFYPIEIFDKIGTLDEKLFIDHVDTEWCLRAASEGFKFFGIWDVVMEHSLGEGGISLWLFRWRTQPIHKPFRLYYIARNSILLYRMKHVPLKWISGDILRLIRLLLIYSIFSSQRMKAIRYFFHGVADGIQNVAGPAPNFR